MQNTLKSAVDRVRGKPLTIEGVLESLETFLAGASPQGGLELAPAPARASGSRPARLARASLLPSERLRCKRQ